MVECDGLKVLDFGVMVYGGGCRAYVDGGVVAQGAG